MSRRAIDPALGLDLVQERTVARKDSTVSVLIPAHNEQETIAEVVVEAARGLELLEAKGEVVVAASGCTDDTTQAASAAGAAVVVTPAGKGAAIGEGLKHVSGEIVCLIDGDFRYFGEEPLVKQLVAPILHDVADATISDLYWRPLYPQLWLYGFFAPLAGRLFPELVARAGSTPWSGQRAAVRELWPETLPDGFTVDLALLLHWNQHAVRLRPVLADDWVNPQRPKPDLMAREFELLVRHGLDAGRISRRDVSALEAWFDAAHHLMADYRPDENDPQEFEQQLLRASFAELHNHASGQQGEGT